MGRPNDIKQFVLDEADEMLSRGFKDQIYDVFRHLNQEIQVILLSATMPQEVLEVTTRFMRDPVRILVKKEELTLENDTMLLYGDMGNYSIGGFQFKFKRHMGKYVWNYHFPSGLFVVVSWVSFLINPTVVPGRMGLLVTLFLVLTNMFNSINASSPIVEGMTSIGIWLLSCIMFVFGAVSEYAVILFLKRKMEDRTHCHNGSALHASTLNMNQDKWEQWAISLANKIPSNDRDIARVDRYSQIPYFPQIPLKCQNLTGTNSLFSSSFFKILKL